MRFCQCYFSEHSDRKHHLIQKKKLLSKRHDLMQFYITGGHWEGRIVSTIFFLLFWDIIYSKPRDIPGIFMSHFQQHPLDMFSESFYLNRKTLIDERLKFIKECSEDKMLALMKHIWDECPESKYIRNRSVNPWVKCESMSVWIHVTVVMLQLRKLAVFSIKTLVITIIKCFH